LRYSIKQKFTLKEMKAMKDIEVFGGTASVVISEWGSSELATVGDHDSCASLARLASNTLDSLHHFHALGYVSEYDVLAIEPSSLHGAFINTTAIIRLKSN